MISYDRILNEITRQLNMARTTGDDYELRESLSAIRSLCEVALSDSTEKEAKSIPKMLISNEVQPVAPLEGKPLQEEGTNGGSIFDF